MPCGTSINVTFILSVPFFTGIVQIDALRSCNSTLTKTQPLVAVFVGGTSGIGEYTIRALVATHSDQGKGLRLCIAGRNTEAAEKLYRTVFVDVQGASFDSCKQKT